MARERAYGFHKVAECAPLSYVISLGHSFVEHENMGEQSSEHHYREMNCEAHLGWFCTKILFCITDLRLVT